MNPSLKIQGGGRIEKRNMKTEFYKYTNAHGNIVLHLESGRVIEYEPKPSGGAKPVFVIEPNGEVFFESDLKRERKNHEVAPVKR